MRLNQGGHLNALNSLQDLVMCGGIKRKFLLCFGALMAQISLFSAQEVSEFDLSQLRISKDSPFYRAMLIDRHYLLSYDYDRLVAYGRREAGLPSQTSLLLKTECRGTVKLG